MELSVSLGGSVAAKNKVEAVCCLHKQEEHAKASHDASCLSLIKSHIRQEEVDLLQSFSFTNLVSSFQCSFTKLFLHLRNTQKQTKKFTSLPLQGLTAVDVTDDSSLIAGGFADSTVRVWSVTPKKLRKVKSAAGTNWQ